MLTFDGVPLNAVGMRLVLLYLPTRRRGGPCGNERAPERRCGRGQGRGPWRRASAGAAAPGRAGVGAVFTSGGGRCRRGEAGSGVVQRAGWRHRSAASRAPKVNTDSAATAGSPGSTARSSRGEPVQGPFGRFGGAVRPEAASVLCSTHSFLRHPHHHHHRPASLSEPAAGGAQGPGGYTRLRSASARTFITSRRSQGGGATFGRTHMKTGILHQAEGSDLLVDSSGKQEKAPECQRPVSSRRQYRKRWGSGPASG